MYQSLLRQAIDDFFGFILYDKATYDTQSLVMTLAHAIQLQLQPEPTHSIVPDSHPLPTVLIACVVLIKILGQLVSS